MNSGQAYGNGYGEAWRDAANYRPYLAYEKRRWAWLWLQRRPDHLTAADRFRTDGKWTSPNRDVFRLLRGDLNELFGMGYSFMLSGAPTPVSMSGSSGLRC